ncbi:MAG: hypothetical protein HQK52_07940 [Oligoflexia bacterium]|nr:hypothetical protein [Oligoflexia bacterium]
MNSSINSEYILTELFKLLTIEFIHPNFVHKILKVIVAYLTLKGRSMYDDEEIRSIVHSLQNNYTLKDDKEYIQEELSPILVSEVGLTQDEALICHSYIVIVFLQLGIAMKKNISPLERDIECHLVFVKCSEETSIEKTE